MDQTAQCTATRAEVYHALDTERNYQDSRWNSSTTQSEGIHSLSEWSVYIRDYLDEMTHVLSREATQTATPKALHIMRKITGMGVAAMEQLGAPVREGF